VVALPVSGVDRPPTMSIPPAPGIHRPNEPKEVCVVCESNVHEASPLACVAEVSTGLTMIASTPELMRCWRQGCWRKCAA